MQLQDGLTKTIEYFEQLLRSDPKDERLPIGATPRSGWLFRALEHDAVHVER
jgi:hypothetical protein